jgi:intracellular septation protein
MKIFFDLLPIFLFFIAYKWGDGHKELAAHWMTQYLGFAVSGGVVGVTEAPTLLGTAVCVLATLVQVIVFKALRKPIDKMLWVSLAIIMVLGGLTLWFHDQTFIKWKPTALYWIMGGGVLISEILFDKRVLAKAMGGQVDVPAPIWRRVAWAWGLFYAGMGVLNLYVAFNYSMDTWVNFKVWGSLVMMIAFIVALGLYMGRYMAPVEDTKSS